jgi:phage gp36-like protein
MRYALPLDPTPGLVRDLAVSIARYLLHRDGAPDYVVRDHEQALKTLREAASGRIALPGTSSLAPIQAPGGTVSVGGSGAVFTDDALGGWR